MKRHCCLPDRTYIPLDVLLSFFFGDKGQRLLPRLWVGIAVLSFGFLFFWIWTLYHERMGIITVHYVPFYIFLFLILARRSVGVRQVFLEAQNLGIWLNYANADLLSWATFQQGKVKLGNG